MPKYPLKPRPRLAQAVADAHYSRTGDAAAIAAALQIDASLVSRDLRGKLPIPDDRMIAYATLAPSQADKRAILHAWILDVLPPELAALITGDQGGVRIAETDAGALPPALATLRPRALQTVLDLARASQDPEIATWLETAAKRLTNTTKATKYR